MNINKDVKQWCDKLKLDYEPISTGGGFYAIQIHLNDGRFIYLVNDDDQIPTSLDEPIKSAITDKNNTLYVTFFSNNLREFYIHQSF